MAIQSAFYFTDGTTRTFPSTKHIASSSNVAVWMKRIVDDVWELTSYELWTLANNSIVFTVAPQSTVYSQIELRIADESDELIESPSNIALVAGSIANVDTVAANISAVNTVFTNIAAVQNTSANTTNINTVSTNIANVNAVAPDITKVNTVATNITNVNSVATTIVPNIAEILLADDNAIIATTKANEASVSATSAQLSKWIAQAEAMTAEAYAITPKGTFVSEYTSNGDGTFTTTPTTKYSALHWAETILSISSNLAPLESAALTGEPTAPTATAGTDTTQIATTAFVNAEIANDSVLKTGAIMTGAITALRETKVAMGANDINLATGNLFTKTISGATTLTVSNWLATGNANSFILELTNGGSAVVTWFSGIKWASGTAPTLTAAGVDILGFYSHDGGTTVRGMVLSKDSK